MVEMWDIQAQGNLQAPAIQVTAGSVDLTSDGGEIKLTGDVVSESIDLSAPLGPIYTGGHLVSATAGGVQVEATNFLTAPGSTSAARVDSTGKLDLTISGADDPGAGAAARIQGTQGSLVVSQTAQSGSVFVNGVLVTDNSVPGGGGGGGSTDDSTTTVDDHGGLLANRGLESEVEVELERSGSNLRGLTLQSSSQQLSSPSTFGVFFADTEHAVSLFPVNNLSLLGSNFIPLYSLQLVSPQVVDNRDGFWQGFIEEFILWTEPEVKEEP
jgi:hypothetical protein